MLQIVVCYNRLRANPSLDVPPRTFLFAGKAAPAYRLAKLIIKLINDVGSVVNHDPESVASFGSSSCRITPSRSPNG